MLASENSLFLDNSPIGEFQKRGRKRFAPNFYHSNHTVFVSVGKIKLNPQKLLLSKWTAVNPQEKEKHFLVTKVIDPEQPKHLIEFVEVEAVLTRRSFMMRWEDLADATKWAQGWI
jgi:tryptophan-rich hypothetical protein